MALSRCPSCHETVLEEMVFCPACQARLKEHAAGDRGASRDTALRVFIVWTIAIVILTCAVSLRGNARYARELGRQYGQTAVSY